MYVLLLHHPQYLVGFGSYLWPTTPLEQRQALGPYHRFFGLAVYAAGLAAAAVSSGICSTHKAWLKLCQHGSGVSDCSHTTLPR